MTTTTGEKPTAAGALRLLMDTIHLRDPLPLGSTAGLVALAPTSVPNALVLLQDIRRKHLRQHDEWFNHSFLLAPNPTFRYSTYLIR